MRLARLLFLIFVSIHYLTTVAACQEDTALKVFVWSDGDLETDGYPNLIRVIFDREYCRSFGLDEVETKRVLALRNIAESPYPNRELIVGEPVFAPDHSVQFDFGFWKLEEEFRTAVGDERLAQIKSTMLRRYAEQHSLGELLVLSKVSEQIGISNAELEDLKVARQDITLELQENIRRELALSLDEMSGLFGKSFRDSLIETIHKKTPANETLPDWVIVGVIGRPCLPRERGKVTSLQNVPVEDGQFDLWQFLQNASVRSALELTQKQAEELESLAPGSDTTEIVSIKKKNHQIEDVLIPFQAERLWKIAFQETWRTGCFSDFVSIEFVQDRLGINQSTVQKRQADIDHLTRLAREKVEQLREQADARIFGLLDDEKAARLKSLLGVSVPAAR